MQGPGLGQGVAQVSNWHILYKLRRHLFKTLLFTTFIHNKDVYQEKQKATAVSMWLSQNKIVPRMNPRNGEKHGVAWRMAKEVKGRISVSVFGGIVFWGHH